MNHISSKKINSFGRVILAVHIDGVPIDQFFCDLSKQPRYKNLWSAWLLNDEENDSRYIWTLLDEKRECNLPILLCPDDMDFWCTMIVAQVSFSEDTVSWNKIGVLAKKIDSIKWRESGIQNLSSWSESDWERYGGTLAWLSKDDKMWEQWCSENWQDEENRRTWNYLDRYLNNDQNIDWFDCPVLTFNTKDYRSCVSSFRSFRY